MRTTLTRQANWRAVIYLALLVGMAPARCHTLHAADRPIGPDETASSPDPNVAQYVDFPTLANSAKQLPIRQLPSDFQPFVLGMVLETLPADYENLKKWGGTREIWDGVKVRFDDGKIKTKRRKKAVNHGSWSRYTLKLVEPQENVRIDLSNVRQLETGEAAFDVVLQAKLDALGQFQEWSHGVRLWSVTVEATADVRLLVTCNLATRIDITQVPPDIIFQPLVTSAELQLADLKLHRISKADGPVVRELSWSVEQIVRDQLAERNDKLVAKINRQIDKNRDSLRISSSRFVKEKLLGSEPPPAESPAGTVPQ